MNMRFPKTWQARIAWIGAVGLLLIIVAGAANCIDQPPTCTHDPCWKLGLRCAWTFINSPIVLGLAATVVSVIGFTVWRKELRGREDHEVAKAILRASYKFRGAFANLRHRVIPAWESAQGDSQVIYGNRWKLFLQELAGLEAAVAEGAVAWGLTYQNRMIPVRVSVIDLEFALAEFLEGRDSKDWTRKEKSVQAAQEFFGSGKEGDIIGKKLIAALQAIEDDAEKRRVR